MNQGILFSNAYFYRFDDKQWKARQPYPPYGTICAAAFLRECGFPVQLFDTNLQESPSAIQPTLAAISPKYFVIYEDGFNYLTKMCLTRMRDAAFELIQMGKKQGCTVIVNSSDSTDHYDQYLNAGADFILLGEGEWTLRELLLQLEAGGLNTAQINGLAYKTDNGLIHQTAKRAVAQHLDELPNPAWDLIDISAYRRIWLKNHGYFSLNIATTRGCPYKCNWCAKPIYGNRYNTRSPERVVTEIEHLITQYDVRHFWMSDDIFGLKPGWVQQFNTLIQERNLHFSYKIQSRVDLLLKEDSIDALAASGLRQVWVGAESGAQKILDAMDKGTTVQEIEEATRLLKKKGIEVCFFLQFGYLGETQTDIEDTIRMVEHLLPHDIGISVSYPLPGTKFYEKVKNLLGEKQNWEQSDDLAMMYPATFEPAYYRRLHRYVHKRFRLKQGLAQIRRLIRTGRTDWRRALLTAYYAPAAMLDAWRLESLARNTSVREKI
jgi:anaerobic magnesium-protoporphyrin IX monomethyl ester cyclase